MLLLVIDNGNDFDEDLNDLGGNSAPKIWGGINKRLLTTDDREISALRNQFRLLHLGWNLWYLDQLDGYGQTIDSLAFEIEAYLETNNFDI